MSETSLFVQAPPAEVFAVLSDPWLYPSWVVGASRMRGADGHWPAPGAVLHHSVGAWPVLIDDTTSVVEMVPDRLLRLRARGWPLGEADIRIELRPEGAGTAVVMAEAPVRGPGALASNRVTDHLLTLRNRETLRRLRAIAEGHVAGVGPGIPGTSGGSSEGGAAPLPVVG